MKKVNTKTNSAGRRLKISDEPSALDKKRARSLGNDPDAPVLPPDMWQNAAIGKYYRPLKTPISLRIDNDVLAWLRSKGEGHISRINGILRERMEQEIRRCGRMPPRMWAAQRAHSLERLRYFTTIVTSVSATVITLTTCLPARKVLIFSSARARASSSSFDVPKAAVMRLRSLPLTCTTISASASLASSGSKAGQVWRKTGPWLPSSSQISCAT